MLGAKVPARGARVPARGARVPSRGGEGPSKRDEGALYFCFIDYSKALTMWITTNCGKFFKRWEFLTCLTYHL